MMKNFSRAAYHLLALACLASGAHACREFTIEAAWKNADAVFVGTIMSLEKTDKSDTGEIRYVFRIDEQLKADPSAKTDTSQEVEVYEPQAGCYGFRIYSSISAPYIVFAENKNGRLVVGHPYPSPNITVVLGQYDEQIIKWREMAKTFNAAQ
jgi:hypothetical protein